MQKVTYDPKTQTYTTLVTIDDRELAARFHAESDGYVIESLTDKDGAEIEDDDPDDTLCQIANAFRDDYLAGYR